MRIKTYSKLAGLTGLLLLPTLVLADEATDAAYSFVETFNEVILFPTIWLLSAVAFLFFLWGCAEYIFNADNEQSRQQGVKHIMWGVIGLVVMFSAYTILLLAANTFGLDEQIDCANDPTLSGCDDAFALPD